MDCLEDGFWADTCFFAFRRARWERLRSTSGLERLTVKSSALDSISAFSDRAGALRLVAAVVPKVTNICGDRRYRDTSRAQTDLGGHPNPAIRGRLKTGHRS